MKLLRLTDQDRPEIHLQIDGQAITARQGDTLLTAILAAGLGHLRAGEFGDGPRAGFCLMGACQDCWVWTESGERLRACTTAAAPGLRILSREPEGGWLRLG